MIIRQEESTLIGDYFHDSGMLKVFTKLQENVDKFEVDTSELTGFCDNLIDSLKGLKVLIKKVESNSEKQEQQIKINDMINRG